MFLVLIGFSFLLAWWTPTSYVVAEAHMDFAHWQPSVAALRITTSEDFFQRLGYLPPQPPYAFDWPDFSEYDVVAVPLNGLAGEPTAEYRIEALSKPVQLDFDGTPVLEVVYVLREECDFHLVSSFVIP